MEQKRNDNDRVLFRSKEFRDRESEPGIGTRDCNFLKGESLLVGPSTERG